MKVMAHERGGYMRAGAGAGVRGRGSVAFAMAVAVAVVVAVAVAVGGCRRAWAWVSVRVFVWLRACSARVCYQKWEILNQNNRILHMYHINVQE